VYYIGNILPLVVIAMLTRFIFMPNAGLIASISKALNWEALGAINFLGDPSMAFWSLFALATWAYIGFQIAYFMANIEQIPHEHYEAALIDGANKWQYAWHIVVPQVFPAVRIMILISVLGCIRLFDLIWLTTQGGPVDSTITLVVYLYKQGFANAQYGKGAAVGVVVFALCLIVTVIQFTTQKKETA
jgi:raffinose/stachyose/melibiose transport system permease protein